MARCNSHCRFDGRVLIHSVLLFVFRKRPQMLQTRLGYWRDPPLLAEYPIPAAFPGETGTTLSA